MDDQTLLPFADDYTTYASIQCHEINKLIHQTLKVKSAVTKCFAASKNTGVYRVWLQQTFFQLNKDKLQLYPSQNYLIAF